MRLFGLIGYPLSHSFSKRYFTAKFEREGLQDCRYELFPIETIDELPSLLNSHEDLEGLNITIPYKRSVLPFLHNREHIPSGLEACNCIRIRDGRLTGYNTDVLGFENSLLPHIEKRPGHAIVLGSGGASDAVVFVLKKLGIVYDVVSREDRRNATITYNDLNEELMKKSTLIINTTPLGMYPHVEDRPPIPYQYISEDHLLYDLVYNPAKTLFMQKGEELGARVVNGEEMLRLQAEESWRIWNQ